MAEPWKEWICNAGREDLNGIKKLFADFIVGEIKIKKADFSKDNLRHQ